MDGDGRNPVPDTELHAGHEMAVERMDAPGPEEANEMQRATRGTELGTQLHERWELIELAGLDALGDADEILRDYPAGPEVQMAYLAVAHLTFREPYRESAGVEESARIAAPEPVPDRGIGQLDRVSIAFGPVAPAVQNHEDDPAPGHTV
jgi:hypothetical protein